jgi:hypothetical protein
VAVLAVSDRERERCPLGGSRTHAEASIALPGRDEGAEQIATLTRRLGLREITSGLPNDRREADE